MLTACRWEAGVDAKAKEHDDVGARRDGEHVSVRRCRKRNGGR